MKSILTILVISLLIGCQSSKLPSKKLGQYEYSKSYSIIGNDLEIELGNPLKCPLRVWIQSENKDLKPKLNAINPIELNPLSDTLLLVPDIGANETKITFVSRLGSTAKKIENIEMELPFPNGYEYKIIQGNNSNFTHNTNWSRYAIDFNLSVNDTICSATNGFVVGLIDQYKYGGPSDKWKPYGNFITIYDPSSGIFTQYVHLKFNGSLVSVGDTIKSGQPIALSGKTGQTDIEHLHFNCLIPEHSNDGLTSIPFEFKKGLKSEDIRKGDRVKKR